MYYFLDTVNMYFCFSSNSAMLDVVERDVHGTKGLGDNLCSYLRDCCAIQVVPQLVHVESDECSIITLYFCA